MRFSAYPDYTSCLEGCVYNETEEDQQTEDMLECVVEASCNVDIMECEHQHGAESGVRTAESGELRTAESERLNRKILFTQIELILQFYGTSITDEQGVTNAHLPSCLCFRL